MLAMTSKHVLTCKYKQPARNIHIVLYDEAGNDFLDETKQLLKEDILAEIRENQDITTDIRATITEKIMIADSSHKYITIPIDTLEDGTDCGFLHLVLLGIV